jgi:hypothetical protein
MAQIKAGISKCRATKWYSTFQHKLMVLVAVLASKKSPTSRGSYIDVEAHPLVALGTFCQEEISTTHPNESKAIQEIVIPQVFESIGARDIPSF